MQKKRVTKFSWGKKKNQKNQTLISELKYEHRKKLYLIRQKQCQLGCPLTWFRSLRSGWEWCPSHLPCCPTFINPLRSQLLIPSPPLAPTSGMTGEICYTARVSNQCACGFGCQCSSHWASCFHWMTFKVTPIFYSHSLNKVHIFRLSKMVGIHISQPYTL